MSNLSENLMTAQVSDKMINIIHESELNSLFLLELLFMILFQLKRSDLSFIFFLKNLFNIKTSLILRHKFISIKKFLSLEINYLYLKLELIIMIFSIDMIVRQMLHIIIRK